MENWLSKIVDIGNIKRNASKKITFIGTPALPEVKNITASCGCTKVKFNSILRILEVTYKAGEIPKQVKGNQSITKYIHVTFADNTQDTLAIKGTKIR